MFEGIPTGDAGLNAYFVHSYHLVPARADALVATTDYAGPITAFVAKDNVAGSQFHPEKSQELGLALIANFLKWNAMILFPAIDLKDGQCVRLRQGEMEQATVFNADPGRAGAGVRGAGLRVAACGRSQRRLRGEAGQ